jgi:acetoacetate decarboxylase
MRRVRYGPRTAEELQASRDARRTVPDVWSYGVTAVWETHPEIVAAVLPPPLEPGDRPLVRVNISQVDIAGMPLGAGSVGVAARHVGVEGWYPLVMPMTTERALIGGREVFGEPKKLGDVEVHRDGDAVRASMTRHGIAFAEVAGTIVEQLETPAPSTKLDFYFKLLPSPDGSGLDDDPALVYCHRDERTRSLARVDGEITLRESPFDPVADLEIVRVVEILFGERQSEQRGKVVARVPAEGLLPYVHQRYDDAMQVLDLPPVAAAPLRTAAG